MTRPVVVLAGGKGARVAHLTGSNLPKAMLPIGGRPFIDLKLEGLYRQGVRDVYLMTGHVGEPLEQHVGDGSQYGLEVTTVRDGPRLLGTGGAIAATLDLLPQSFWVTYGDTLLRVPIGDVEGRFDSSRFLAYMTVLHNRDRWELSNVSTEDERITAYEKNPLAGTHEYIDYGMSLFDRAAFVDNSDVFDLYEIIQPLISSGSIGAFEIQTRFYDIGTEARYSETEEAVGNAGPSEGSEEGP